MWLAHVKEGYGDKLDITWRHFSLEQNAYALKQGGRGNGDWKVWEQEDLTAGRSMLSQVVSEAARRQGQELHDKFSMALLDARHGGEGRIRLNDVEALAAVAGEAGLDVDRLRRDMNDPELPRIIGRDHEEAVARGIFGTPTFVFENGNTAFLKTFTPPQEDAVPAFEHFVEIAAGRAYFGEIKRPQPPWPKGSDA